MANTNDVLKGHVALEVECVDRLYRNAYLPSRQVGGQVVRFMTQHLGKPIPSAALLGRGPTRRARGARVRACGSLVGARAGRSGARDARTSGELAAAQVRLELEGTRIVLESPNLDVG